MHFEFPRRGDSKLEFVMGKSEKLEFLDCPAQPLVGFRRGEAIIRSGGLETSLGSRNAAESRHPVVPHEIRHVDADTGSRASHAGEQRTQALIVLTTNGERGARALRFLRVQQAQSVPAPADSTRF